MAARLFLKKITGNPQACSMNGICRSPGIDKRTTLSCFLSPGMVNTTPQDRGCLLNNKPGAAKDGYVELWNNEHQVEKQKLLLPCFAATKDRGYVELVVEQQIRLAELVKKTTNKLQVEQQRLLLQKVQLQKWMKNFKGSLLSIQDHHELGGEEILKFIITRPFQNSLSKFSTRSQLSLQQRPGPYNLPRQAVEGVVCITTKDAFRLHNTTTGDSSPWIDITATREGRQVESIALGFDPQSKQHKVVCISSYVPARETTRTEYVVVEVLNVHHGTWTKGQHKWRKLKDGAHLPRAYCEGKRIAFLDGPVHVDGRIHWLIKNRKSIEWILNFNVKAETFIFTPLTIPRQGFGDISGQYRLMLMIVDGKIALLKSITTDQKVSSLWICHRTSKCGNNQCSDIKWTKEENADF
ncbi:uncharacterized protein LOC113308269 [Papaver somniferum]|uniref:uncharacterized protein LOC113308269 n=1 Tax=Papaver somniferum TaxID=3469 RepID=UPI000E6FDD1D|nr:uncharacterized protein LOC113308269 [Papaver somniferum]